MAEEADTNTPEPEPTEEQSDSAGSEDIERLNKALAAERKLRAAAEKRVKELEPKEQGYNERITALENELKGERLTAVKATVAAEKGVPATALVGDTREELETFADQLLEWRGKAEKPSKPTTSSGLKSGATGTDSRMDPQERAAAALRSMRRQ